MYRAQVRGNVSESKIQELQRGPLVDGVKYRPIEVTVQSTDKKDSWLQVKLAEGKVRFPYVICLLICCARAA